MKEKSIKEKLKRDYIPPILKKIDVEMEHGIAAGSAGEMRPGDYNNEVREEWNDQPVIQRDNIW